jgi:hypothetical protein
MNHSRSRLRIILLHVVMGCIIAIPVLAEVVFSDLLPAGWRIANWPKWVQIPFGIIVAIYVIAEIWYLIYEQSRSGRND